MSIDLASARTEIVTRCQRIGWAAEQSKTKTAKWLVRVKTPGESVIEIPKGSGDEAIDQAWERLNAEGFFDAEREYLVREMAERDAAPTTAGLALADAVFPEQTSKREGNGKHSRSSSVAFKYGGLREVDLDWLMKPSRWPETRTVIMTPQAAARVMAERNTHNRPLSPKRVAFFEGLILNDEFGCTHQGAAMDTDGILQDGQTRFQAIINTGVSVVMQVSVGMPKENFGRVDAGTTRSGADTIYVAGEHVDAKTISSAMKMLMVIDGFAGDSHVRERSMRISNDKLAHVLPNYREGIRPAIMEAKRLRHEMRRASLAGLVTAIYLLRDRLPSEHPLLLRFLDDVESGEMLARDSAASALRRVLTNGRLGGKMHGRWETAALTLKAWNRYARNEPVSNLIWRSDEGFPSAVFLPPGDMTFDAETDGT